MYLNSKQLLFLAFPFIVSVLVYFFSAEIVNNANYIFPAYEKYSNKDLDAKTGTYLQIEAEIKKYKNIEEKIIQRKNEAKWAADNLLNEKSQDYKPVLSEQVESKQHVHTVQALFPENKTAIIDDLIVKEGGEVYGAVIVKIEKNRVQLKTKKGLKWLTLFQ
ncbi:hypothetical protein [Sulfurimonas sp.]|uniref:hypothetical protein n=1 Tax=Sulfurimonas sp. TaxID=2022749 RepID=UPI00286DBBE8|nr:hypothetical protein [Sulfurimonas sp.]